MESRYHFQNYKWGGGCVEMPYSLYKKSEWCESKIGGKELFFWNNIEGKDSLLRMEKRVYWHENFVQTNRSDRPHDVTMTSLLRSSRVHPSTTRYYVIEILVSCSSRRWETSYTLFFIRNNLNFEPSKFLEIDLYLNPQSFLEVS